MKPSFTSPQPLAASAGLTIPIQITLSDIKLSAFIILVFSKQKGLTLVFRNDPLESLKVSSTFDAIPFVREYLQKEIEGQLRGLLMDEVPVIIHRLSLRLWVPEYRDKEDQELAQSTQDVGTEEKLIDPLASPPQDAVDGSGNILDASQIASLSLDSGSELHALFSQKNLLRLSALTDSQRTLSLFTPSIRDAVFRAWAGPTERGDIHGSGGRTTPSIPTMARGHSHSGTTSTTYVFSDHMENTQRSVRPTLSSIGSAPSGLGLVSSKHGKPHGGRKRKHRVVNLRKRATTNDELESVSGESTTASGTMSSTLSESRDRPRTPESRDDELVTPPRTPETTKLWNDPGDVNLGSKATPISDLTPRRPQRDQFFDENPRPSTSETPSEALQTLSAPYKAKHPSLQPSRTLRNPQHLVEKAEQTDSSSPAQPPLRQKHPSPYVEPPSNGVFEQTWMTKMVSEIARKVQDQKAMDSGFWDRNEMEEAPPPAYGS